LIRSKGVLLVAALVASAAVAACGGDDDDGGGSSGGDKKAGGELTVYSSLPLQGETRPNSVDVVRGIEMALEQAGGRAGNFTIKHKSLDDSTASAGKWEAGRVSSNARQVINDESAIAYLGEFNSGGSAISIPITNEGGLLQLSPSNTAIGLTREGGEADEPAKYYPSGTRTYARVVPADHIQAAAQVTWQKENGCTKLYLTDDKEVYGKGLADRVESIAKEQGLQVLGHDGIDTKAANFRSLAAKIASSGADCFFHGGITANKGVQLFKDVHAADPDLKLFGPDGVAEVTFFGEVGSSVERQTFVTAPTLDPKEYPPAGQEFFERFEAKFRATPQPYALYGYEAMSLVMDAIKRAGDNGNDRQAVIEAVFSTKARESVLGTYDIDKNGDTTLSDYGGYRIRKGELVFDRVIKAQTQ
jgi:branched-chain amino acid transport system substrate-binding protein